MSDGFWETIEAFLNDANEDVVGQGIDLHRL